jgi:hypothetical protein
VYRDNPYLIFCSKDEAVAAIKRTGGRAGKLVPIENSSPSSTLFVKPKNGISIEEMITIISLSNLTETSNFTASVKAVSASEIHKKLSEFKKT